MVLKNSIMSAMIEDFRMVWFFQISIVIISRSSMLIEKYLYIRTIVLTTTDSYFLISIFLHTKNL